MTKEKSCGALVYRKQGEDIQVLVLRHKMGGHWSFPKGHVEEGETEVQTALREVQEETGLSISLHDGFREMVSYCPRPGVSKDVVYFLGFAEDSRTVRQEEEISEIRWVNMGGIGNYLTYDNDRRLVRGVKRYLRGKGVLPREEWRGRPRRGIGDKRRKH
ncbi:MAG: NUDIX domain-containing protein [Oscillospiraceae bacterium]|nr:NUDIX domain-containing protein [Oscillospiraceae bacterium]